MGSNCSTRPETQTGLEQCAGPERILGVSQITHAKKMEAHLQSGLVVNFAVQNLLACGGTQRDTDADADTGRERERERERESERERERDREGEKGRERKIDK